MKDYFKYSYLAISLDISSPVNENLTLTKGLFHRAEGILLNATCISRAGHGLNFTDQEVYTLLQMLSPLEPLKRHQDIRASRLENSGKWLLQLDIFCTWSDMDTNQQRIHPPFCCYGIPGAGKTFIR